MIRRRLKFYLAGAVSVAAFIVYFSALQNEFIQWDDGVYVYENHHIRSLSGAFFRWAFFDFYAGNWHPLTWISHALDYAIWGLNPLGHHLTNNTLHAVNTFVVVLLTVQLLEIWQERAKGEKAYTFPDARGALVTAATTGLLFGLHPLHVESVAWVSERKDLLCGLFFIMSVMMYLRYPLASPKSGGNGTPPPSAPLLNPTRPPLTVRVGEGGIMSGGGKRWYLLSLFFFILALLSKPMAVTLPLVLLILDWYPFERVRSLKAFWTVCLEKLPFMALSLGSSVLTIVAQNAEGAVKSMEFAPLSTRVLVGFKSLIAYLWKMILPVNLVPFYPYPKKASLWSMEYLVAIALVIGITIACIAMARRRKLWLSAWGYYVIMLLPVLGMVQVGQQSMADRYTYLPGLAPSLIIGLMAAWIWAKIERKGKRGHLAKYLTGVASVVVIISLSYLTFRQIDIWKNSIVFWSYVIDKEPEKVLSAYINRGIAFEKIGQVNRAIADYDKVISIDPLYFEAYNNRGVLYGQAGMFDKATEYFSKSIEINPDFEEAYVNRGIAYAMSGQDDRALEDFSKVIFLNQESAEAYFNRGSLYLRKGSNALAVSDFRKACNLGKEQACVRSAEYGGK